MGVFRHRNMAAMACSPTLMRAAMSELPVLHRSCTVPVNSAEYTMERTNSNDLLLMDYLSRTTSGLQQALSRTNSGEALNVTKNDTLATVPTHKRKRSLTINTSPGNFFQRCLQSPGEKSPSALKLSPTLPTLSRAGSFNTGKVSPTLPTLSRTASKDSLFGSILADVLDVPTDPGTRNSVPESSSLIEPPPLVEPRPQADCMHQLDAQQIAQALCRARNEYNTALLEAHHQPAAVPSLSSEPKGPFGPYNPCPSYMLGLQRLEQLSAPYQMPAAPPPPDEFAGKVVTMIRGKYCGKKAFVQRRVNKKYRVQVEGVAWGLEFYPDMFRLGD